jgi:hypothetical protein
VCRFRQHSSVLRRVLPSRVGVLALTAVAVLSAVSGSPAFARRVAVQQASTLQQSTGPLLVLVSIRKQRLRVFSNNGEVTSSRISSGQPGYDTPTGVFSILEKHVTHESNIYSGAQMPFMQRITWSGIAMHAGIVPGYRASHGCVRLPYNFSRSLFDITHVGNRVVISQDETEPIAFAHPFLFKPLPADAPPTQGSTSIEEKKIAVNDTDPGKSQAMQDLMAPPPADDDAAHAAPMKPRTRAEMQRQIESKLNEVKAQLKAAEEERVTAAKTALNSGRAIEDAKSRAKNARQVVENFRHTAEAALKKRADVMHSYEDFMKSEGQGVTAGPAAEDQEAVLEARLLDATIDADSAREEAQRRESELVEFEAAVTAAEAARTKSYDDVKTAEARIRSIQAAAILAQKEIQQKARTVAIFVSLKAQRIYVRQGFEPVVEAPIAINGTPGKIGTHVLTAMDYAPGGNEFAWKLVTAQPPSGDADEGRKSRKKDQSVEPTAGQRAARTALDAISIPDEIRQRITEVIRPGASMIVSDRELSGETGDGTEFVLLTR